MMEREDEVVLQRLRTGKPTQSEAGEDIYALYQATAADAMPGVETSLETLYLATGELREVQLSEKSARTRLGHYDAAIDGILRREFPRNPNDRRCPRYFVVQPERTLVPTRWRQHSRSRWCRAPRQQHAT